ncbi:MAG: hypothetical protein RLO12_16695, partial [Fulvivirga sp.]
MRKIVLLVLSLFVFSFSNAQLQLGLKFSPQMSLGRTLLSDDARDFEADDPGFKFALGLMVDYGFAENYFFSTGVSFMPKRVAFLISNEDGSSLPAVQTMQNIHKLKRKHLHLKLLERYR